ncbi:MAG: LPS export ABC transporter periplasmic protein LptC [Deltaproteobacteria bacterium]|nr:LPS export ABC transporter periplasmic protein LptC [Deltaproteobacteria bacterium]RLB90640.1 MAG: LPS export ABC transporter periplasmic protein LptC [Deltaproteobacteria bacterium]RLB91241.1 MAG: LPS export ABC transporter periplasmic protein LptC [Deltaproteobacteria bacterium]RLC09113.1 MAG: LPS export ABC transporter periplasmic protein LptC [Deltaproteobacteria bacterium]
MSKVRIVLISLIGMMFAGLGVGLFSYYHIRDKSDALISALPGGADVRLHHVHHVATRDGKNEWVLDAESARYEKTENKTVLKDLSATFFLKDGKTVHLAGDKGVLLADTKEMEVSGNVIVRSGSYETTTDKLHYDYKNRSISTSTPILLTGKRVQITGRSMVFYLNTEQIVVKGNVKAVFKGWKL